MVKSAQSCPDPKETPITIDVSPCCHVKCTADEHNVYWCHGCGEQVEKPKDILPVQLERGISGVWTPWAQVLCYRCHGPKFPSEKVSPGHMLKYEEKAYPELPEQGHGFCDKCGRTIVLPKELANLSRLKHELFKLDIDVFPDLQQTGGMCAALSVDVHGKEWGAFVTCMEGYYTFQIGVYALIFPDDEDYNPDHPREPNLCDDITFVELRGVQAAVDFIATLPVMPAGLEEMRRKFHG